MGDSLLARASSFGVAADAYERGRPSYPAEAVDWLLPEGARRVLDLGAGTGKLTRELHERGLEVVTVDPSAGMRERLARALPGVAVVAGTAESIPVLDRSVHAVLVAQAWHWVDPIRALAEVARVLTDGGRLGLVWNIRDERQGWVAELGRIMHRHGEEDDGDPAPAVGAPFAALQRHDVEWRYHLGPAALVDLVASRSYVITLANQRRAALLGEVRELIATHPDLAGRDDIVMPYVSRCYRTELSATVANE